MTAASIARTNDLVSEVTAPAGALYPPTVTPPTKRMSLPRFIATFVKNPLAVVPAAAYEQPITVARSSRRTLAWVTDPAMIKTILLDRRDIFLKTAQERRVLGPLLGNGILTSDGADWKWQRQTAAPVFRHQDLLDCVPAICAAAERLVGQWRAAEKGIVHAIDRDMTMVTFDVIAETLLPGGHEHVGKNIGHTGRDNIMPISWRMMYALFQLPTWLPHPGKWSLGASEQALRASVLDLINDRRASTDQHDDLMQRLMNVRNPETGQPMSDAQLVDNLLTFFMAGHETTAKALTWTLYLLCRAPEWEARIVDEIARVAGDGPVEARHIDKLVITQQVLKESMRLYPPAPVISRRTAEPVQLGDEMLPANTQTIIPIYALQRNKLLWEDPGRFDPTRFSAENEAKIPRYQYMPFGAGPRICIGMAFAMIEATAILATLVRAARFEVRPGYAPTPISRVTLRPEGGMPMKVFMR